MGIIIMLDVRERDDGVVLYGCKYVEYSVNILLSDIHKNMLREHHNKNALNEATSKRGI